MSWHIRVLANRYADSVRLMSISRAIREQQDVRRCELGMGTAANLEFLAGLGADAQASPVDLVIAVEADDGAASNALVLAGQQLEALHAPRGADERGAVKARSLGQAARLLDAANIALISVPGEYAALEAHQALSAGLHVFLFSDHVPLEAELELKRRGAHLGLLVMGPECGTAMLGGIGLGFANVLAPGPVGIVAAAGTGAQESACLLDAAGVGVSHIVGVGGRDLSAEVGGIMFRRGMQLLAEDPGTETLLLVSKPPSPDAVRALAGDVPEGVRVIAAFVGWEGGEAPFEVHSSLEAGAAAAAGTAPPDASNLARAVDARRAQTSGYALLGLYSGGSLAHEAATILEPVLGPIAGNVGGGPSDEPSGHRIFDLGEEQFTQGRPHPMVDLTARVEMLERAAADERTGCILMDVVLGYGAHPDPAGGLFDAVRHASKGAAVIAHVCGTGGDPQDGARQQNRLRDAGALVAPSNAAAARLALRAVG